MSKTALSKKLNDIIKNDYLLNMYTFMHYPKYLHTKDLSWIYNIDNDFIHIDYYMNKTKISYEFFINCKCNTINVGIYNDHSQISYFVIDTECTEEQLFQISLLHDIGILNIKHIRQCNKLFKKYYIQDY